MKEPIFESTDKYVTKFEYELAGKTFDLVMDNGYEYVVSFLSGEILMWAESGEPFHWEKYHCLKSDDTTYFVNMEVYGQPLRTCRTMILDLENSLVTLHTAKQGGIPLRPRMVQTEIVFGTIRQPGLPLPVKRHGYTAELVGKKVNWTYSSGFVNTHIYVSETYCRARAITRPELSDTLTPEQKTKIKADLEKEKIWIYEEPIKCVKIKGGMYLCSFIEDNMNKRDNSIGGNNLLTLSNMKEGFDIGRTFCLDVNQQPESGMFIAYGSFTDEDTEIEHMPSPYRV
ncbi:MAG TPA: MoaF N-terminal domain-containing protein [Clostridia bacterium]|nr:MoaF N-terminal domain-containing protein [Clostridia bacterium]